MKKVLVLIIALGAAGCSMTAIREDSMQHDGSYKIVAGGGGFTSHDKVMDAAKERAQQICPNGFDVRTQFCDDEFKAGCTMIINCKDSE